MNGRSVRGGGARGEGVVAYAPETSMLGRLSFLVALVLVTLAGGATAQELSTVCRFTTGPLAGQLRDFPFFQPVPVGTACNDVHGSEGQVVPRPTASSTSGPLSG